MTRHPHEGDLRGLAREVPEPRPGPQIDSARWPVTDVIPVGRDWVSGVYVARLLLTSGEHAGLDAFAPFVVRAPLDSQRAAILVQQPVTTAQAYNNWGGKSLYTSNSTEQEAAVKVSFDRPYAAWSELVVNARWPFVWDYHLLRYLEREGFHVAYTTDVDTHREPWNLVGHRLLMTSGHDEYWTREMRDAFDTQLQAGVNLACMGANSGYWQIRLEDAERTMVEYRWRARDPEPDRALKTEMFRNLQPPRPECGLWGVQYQDGLGKPGEPRHYELTRDCLEHPWMQGTGFEYPATLHGLVGYEWDALQEGFQAPDAHGSSSTTTTSSPTPTSSAGATLRVRRCSRRAPCSSPGVWTSGPGRATVTSACSASCATRSWTSRAHSELRQLGVDHSRASDELRQLGVDHSRARSAELGQV